MEIFIIVIVWVLCGFLINEMAKVRNRNQVLWVSLSLLTSPIVGILALALVGKAEKE